MRNPHPGVDAGVRAKATTTATTTAEVFYRELKWAFNQCPFLTTSHEINGRK